MRLTGSRNKADSIHRRDRERLCPRAERLLAGALVALALLIVGTAPAGAANVPDGEQVGYTTSGSLEQLVAVAPGDVCTVRMWVGKRCDGAGSWGRWYVQLTTGGWNVQNVMNGSLAAQADEWARYEATFTVGSFPSQPIRLRIKGQWGFESYDRIELDCGTGDLVSNGSFESPLIDDGTWTTFGNPAPDDWTTIGGGAGVFNPNLTQFCSFCDPELDSDFDGVNDCDDECPGNALLTSADPVTGCDVVCTPGAAECAGPSLLVCNDTGDGYDQQVCNNGCDSAPDPDQCVAEDLRLWDIVAPCGGPNEGSWDFSLDGTSGRQIGLSAYPTLLLSPVVVEPPIRIQGEIGVTSASVDDDLIGFVFGYLGPGHFYLLDWKRGAQSDISWGGFRAPGIRLGKVHYPTADATCDRGVISQGTAPDASTLSPASANPTPWIHDVTYRFFLEWRTNGDIDISMTRVDTGDVVGTISLNDVSPPDLTSGGRFGFYGLSQFSVVYSGYQIGTPIP